MDRLTDYKTHRAEFTAKDGNVAEFARVKDLVIQKAGAEKQKEVFDSLIARLRKSYLIEVNKEAIGRLGGNDKGGK